MKSTLLTAIVLLLSFSAFAGLTHKLGTIKTASGEILAVKSDANLTKLKGGSMIKIGDIHYYEVESNIRGAITASRTFVGSGDVEVITIMPTGLEQFIKCPNRKGEQVPQSVLMKIVQSDKPAQPEFYCLAE